MIRIFKEKVETVYVDINTDSVEFALDMAEEIPIDNYIYSSDMNSDPEHIYHVSKIVKL